MDILLGEESGWIDLSQGIGRLINAIVAVLGPELAPGSILFSRCKVLFWTFEPCLSEQEDAFYKNTAKFSTPYFSK